MFLAGGYNAKDYSLLPTGVKFSTADTHLQEMYDCGERFLGGNEDVYGDKRVILEGGAYRFVWLETQPLGGEMYAKRNLEVGLNNILFFLQHQRRDGRFPGMISKESQYGGTIDVHYDWLQGYYWAMPALKMWYLIGKDCGYLEKVYSALKDFDNYLWSCRDSDGDGCLESWCVWDTGEDNCARYLSFGAKDGGFGGETPPTGNGKFPYESMEFMAYSYANRNCLSKISLILENGESSYWTAEAEKIRKKVYEYLWDKERHACFDRDCDNKTVESLSHVNMRCMYHGLFSQEMADDFLKYHLFNPDEFWTFAPLTATAIHDPFFLNDPKNNWSGACQGLIYQRSIDALHNYGHYAEAALVGRKVLSLVLENGVFYQQYDPFTGKHCDGPDGYGPMIFSFMEYLSFLQGVNISMDEVHWSNAVGGADSEYTQFMFGKEFRLVRKNGKMTAFLMGKELFSADAGLRLVTDLDGKLLKMICIDSINRAAVNINNCAFAVDVKPNGIYEFTSTGFKETGRADYFVPDTVPK